MDTLDAGEKQVWLRAFYGFDPEGSGYLGFTHEPQRAKMLDRMRDGDLVLIYGAVDDLTRDDLKAQALGFLEVSLDPCTDHERMSSEALAWKREHGFEDRWTFGITVTRAWRVQNRVHIRTIAPKAYSGEHRFERTTRAILLEDDERIRALSHTVREVSVFGEEPIGEEPTPVLPMEEALKPSRGIPPSVGPQTHNHEDGETIVYLMVYTGGAEHLLGQSGPHAGQSLAKIGRTNNPVRRAKELNAGFPEKALFSWKPICKQAFPDGASAHRVEDAIKQAFEVGFTSQGNEFFTGEQKAMEARFWNECLARLPKIMGAPGTAKGVRR